MSRDLAVAGALAVAVAMTFAASAAAQTPSALVSADVVLADYGVSSLDDVVRGRVSLVHDPAGLRLAPQFLRPADVPSRRSAEESSAASGPPRLPPRGADGGSAPLRALWVWTTERVLAERAERVALLDFVEAAGIDRVFLHLPPGEGLRASSGYVPFDGDELGPLLAELRARGALTYGLDGDPYYVRPENHDGVLRTVRRVAEHNRGARPEERFHGVRYDIEPYLLPGFQGPGRALILNRYVQLIADVADAARAGGLAFGLDIPFWLDGADEVTGERFEATLAGERALVLEHVMGLADDVAVMAYRTSATGPDGVVTHAAAEIVLGAGARAEVFVGLETTRLFDESLHTFRGPGREGLPTLADAPWVVLEELEGGRARVWFAEGEAALARLARETGEPSRLRYWFAGSPVPLPGDKLSFHALGADALASVVGEVLAELSGRPGFLGLAFHDYLGLRSLLGSR